MSDEKQLQRQKKPRASQKTQQAEAPAGVQSETPTKNGKTVRKTASGFTVVT